MDLARKYRPKDFNEVLGQESVVKSLSNIIEKKTSSAFLFYGSSGIGKTSLARICAEKLNCSKFELKELDAASNSGVNNMREIISMQDYYPLNNSSRVFIIDEAHGLSKSAWDVMLKAIEEPPENNYWFFCTTEVNKVPKTIRTRCVEFHLKPLSKNILKTHLLNIASKENINCPEKSFDIITDVSEGSPRKALKLLQKADKITTEELKNLINIENESSNAYKLAKILNRSNFSLASAIDVCNELKNISPESVRQTVRAYHTSVCLSSPENKWSRAVLHFFETPSIEQNKITDIVLRVFKLDKIKVNFEHNS